MLSFNSFLPTKRCLCTAFCCWLVWLHYCCWLVWLHYCYWLVWLHYFSFAAFPDLYPCRSCTQFDHSFVFHFCHNVYFAVMEVSSLSNCIFTQVVIVLCFAVMGAASWSSSFPVPLMFYVLHYYSHLPMDFYLHLSFIF